jgi:zinc protease
MMTEGTTVRSSLELAGAAEDLGSFLGHEAGRDGASIGLTTLAEDFSRALDLIAEVVEKPAFRAEELERVRAEWLEHLIAERQEPRRLGSLVGMRALFGDVRGASVTGSPRDVRSLSVEDLRSFHSRVFTPPNAALVVSGEIAPEQVRAAAEQAFANWRGPAWPPPTSGDPPALPDTPRVVLVPRRGAVQSALFVAQPFPTRLEAGHEARELLATLFGGLFTSRINRNLREEHGFTYGASAGALAGRNLGAFLVSTMVETSVTAPALTEIQKELEGLRDPDRGEPIRAEELTRARSALIGGLAARLTTTADIATDLSSVFTLGLPLNYLEGYPALLTAIPADAVSREATRLSSKRIVVTVVGDPAVREPLTQAGFTVIDVDPAWLE